MPPDFSIVRLVDLPVGLEDLRAEAAEEGFRFVETLVAEWHAGRNRFQRPGEVFLGGFGTEGLLAVGGLNRDPYAEREGVGRLRHLYVRAAARRSGVGSALVRDLLTRAEAVFHAVRLRTDSRRAADFYVGLGFRPVRCGSATHRRDL